MIETAIRMFSL